MQKVLMKRKTNFSLSVYLTLIELEVWTYDVKISFKKPVFSHENTSLIKKILVNTTLGKPHKSTSTSGPTTKRREWVKAGPLRKNTSF